VIYEFSCPSCGKITEEWQAMNDDHTPGTCTCGAKLKRVYGFTPVDDSIGSGVHFNPITRKTEAYNGLRFDIGLGQWTRTKSERKYWMKRLNLQEHPDANKAVV